MSPRPTTFDPIRDPTVRAIANAIFAELFRLGKVNSRSWDDVLAWAGDLLDARLRGQSRLPTLDEINEHVRASVGVTGP
jgi:hypothetical protein